MARRAVLWQFPRRDEAEAQEESTMPKSITPLLLVATLAAAGCVSQAQFLDGKQGMAMQTVR